MFGGVAHATPSPTPHDPMLNTGHSTRLFRVGRVPVYADAGAALLLVLLLVMFGSGRGPAGMIAAVLITIIVFASVLAHELGHAFAIRRLGYGDSRIVLGGLGGVCQWSGRPTRWDRIRISLAGPAVSMALGLGGFALLSALRAGGIGAETIFGYTVYVAAWLNVGWALFNMLPVQPMDGGQATRAFLGTRMPQHRAVRLSLQISLGVAIVLAAVSLALTSSLFIPILLAWMAFQNWQELQRLAA